MTAGNVIDASTIKNVISHLKRNGINTKFAILDAGYYNGINADALIDAKVSFISRVHSGHTIFKDAVAQYRSSLECKEKFLTYNRRFYYIKKIECRIENKSDKVAYAYLGLDVTMRDQQKAHLAGNMSDKHMSDEEIYDSMDDYGVFMLIATRPISTIKILPLYHMRNQVEEVFRVDKGKGKLLPLRTATEETLRGHLMITFITAVILTLLQDKISDKKYTAGLIFEKLRYQQGIVYEDPIVPSVAVKDMNEIYKFFKIPCPNEMPLPSGNEAEVM